jgi:hypothetical protein
MLLLGSGISIILIYSATGKRGPAFLLHTFQASVVLLAAGLFSPHLSRKRRKLGKYQIVFLKHTTMCLGFAFGCTSVYAQPSFDTNTNDTSFYRATSTFLSLTLPIISLALLGLELERRAVWSTKGVTMAFVTSLPMHYGPVAFHWWMGDDSFDQLYNTTRAGDALFLYFVGGTVATSTDQLLLTMVLKKVMYAEQRVRMMSSLWLGFGIYVTAMLGYLCGGKAVAMYTLCCGLDRPLQRLIPAHYFNNFDQNRADLGPFVYDNSGSNLSVFVKGGGKDSGESAIKEE